MVVNLKSYLNHSPIPHVLSLVNPKHFQKIKINSEIDWDSHRKSPCAMIEAQGDFFIFINGEILENIDHLKRCFSLEELLYSYCNGEFAFWLNSIGETEKAAKLSQIEKLDAYMLLKLYQIFDLNPNLMEEEIWEQFISPKQP